MHIMDVTQFPTDYTGLCWHVLTQWALYSKIAILGGFLFNSGLNK